VTYAWDFDSDGTYGDTYESGTDTHPVKTFAKGGTFNVDLQVTDNNGAKDTLDTTIPVHVSNHPPTAAGGFTVSAPYYINTYYDLSADASSDPDGTITTYEWDTNYDGVTFKPTFSTKDINTYWTAEGEYDIMLRVVDDDGAEDFLDTPIHISVLWTDNAPPVVDSILMSRTTTKMNTPAEAITFTCNAHDPNVGDNLTYHWTCASGSFDVDNQQVVHWTAPNQVGHFYVTCRVYDSFNAWDEMQSDMIRVTQYPTSLATAPPAFMWTLETVWNSNTNSLSTFVPGNVVYMNFWQTT